MKQYKAISGPQTIDMNSHENISEAAEKYEKFVNEQAAAGWEYHSASTIIVNKKGGCLRKDSAAKYKMMIFAREGTEGGSLLAGNEIHSQVSFETANTENTTDTATHASNKKWIFIVLACLLVVLIGVVVCIFLGWRVPFFGEDSKTNENFLETAYFCYNIPKSYIKTIPTLNVKTGRHTEKGPSYGFYYEVLTWEKDEALSSFSFLFKLTFVPIEYSYDGDAEKIGTYFFDKEYIIDSNITGLEQGKYDIYIEYSNELEMNYSPSVVNALPPISDIVHGICPKYGLISFNSDREQKDLKEEAENKQTLKNDKSIRDFSEDEIVKAVELRYAGTRWIYDLLREDGLLDEQDTVTISQYMNDDEWKGMDSYVEFPSAFGMDSEEKIRSYLLNYYTDRILNNDQFIKSYEKINNSYYFEYNYGMGWPGACAGGEYDIEYLSDDSLIFHSRNWNKDLDSQPGYDVHFYLLLEDGNLKLDKFYFDNDSQIGIY